MTLCNTPFPALTRAQFTCTFAIHSSILKVSLLPEIIHIYSVWYMYEQLVPHKVLHVGYDEVIDRSVSFFTPRSVWGYKDGYMHVIGTCYGSMHITCIYIQPYKKCMALLVVIMFGLKNKANKLIQRYYC